MKTARRKAFLAIILVIIGVMAAVFVLFTVQNRNIQQEVLQSKVREATGAVRQKFLEIAEPVNRDLFMLAKWGQSGLLNLGNTRSLNSKVIPMIESQSMVSALIIADTDGREYFLLREKQSWLTRAAKTYRPGMQVTLSRWRTADKRLKTWQEKRSFDPRKRTWFAGALQTPDSGAIFWTEPYRFETARKPGITASVRWQARGNRAITVAALDILLDDLYRFLSGLRVTAGSRVLLVRKDGSLMAASKQDQKQQTLPAGDVSFISPTDLQSGLLKDAMAVWENNRTKALVVEAFPSSGQKWWAGFQPLQSGKSGTWVGVIIPQQDLEETLHQKLMPVILMAAAILVAGLVLIIFLARRYGQKYTGSAQPIDGTAGMDADHLLEMITAGESSTLEFKSTVRTNLKTGKADKAIELAWLKGVVAFMNTEGGMVLIGVNDEGGIVGLEADGFENDDKCRLHLKNLINQHIGAEFSGYINYDLQRIHSKTIVVVACEKTAEPVFLKVGKNEDFFIRSGPSSIRLSMSQMIKYLEQR